MVKITIPVINSGKLDDSKLSAEFISGIEDLRKTGSMASSLSIKIHAWMRKTGVEAAPSRFSAEITDVHGNPSMSRDRVRESGELRKSEPQLRREILESLQEYSAFAYGMAAKYAPDNTRMLRRDAVDRDSALIIDISGITSTLNDSLDTSYWLMHQLCMSPRTAPSSHYAEMAGRTGTMLAKQLDEVGFLASHFASEHGFFRRLHSYPVGGQ